MLDDYNLDLALNKISPISMEGRAVRCQNIDYKDKPLSVKGSLINGGRFNIPGKLLEEKGLPFESVLYIARNMDIAMKEADAKWGSAKHVMVRILYKLDNVLDLTDRDNLSILGTSYQELTGNWRQINDELCEISSTQRLALAVQRSNSFNAIKVHSEKTMIGENYNLVIFIDEVNELKEINRNGISLKAESIDW
jgi:RES domain